MGMQPSVPCRAALCLLTLATFAAPAAEETQTRPAVEEPVATITDAPVEIVSSARLPQGSLPPSRVPAAVEVITSEELQKTGLSLPEALGARVAGAWLSDEPALFVARQARRPARRCAAGSSLSARGGRRPGSVRDRCVGR